MSQFYVGIDISKTTFDVALLGGAQTARSQFANDQSGFQKLAGWLQRQGASQVHACLEATGRYWVELALFLHEQGHAISVVNPKLIKKHSEAIMQRNKTDRQDALTIADYCAKQQPDLWTPPTAAYRQLQEMVRHLYTLKGDRTRVSNRRQSGLTSQEVLALLEEQLALLDRQIEQLQARIAQHIDNDPQLKADKELLLTIPGIGQTTAAVFLAEVPDVTLFKSGDQVAAFAGLTPGQQLSGTSLRRPARLVKWGNAHLRTALYMPALSAHRHNPIAAALRERLLQRGKSKMTTVVAVMRKLLILCYGVLKTRKPFDPHHAHRGLAMA